MASVEDLAKSNFGYYTPELKLSRGWYPVHVTKATVTPPRSIKNKYKAKIYNLGFTIADVGGYTVKNEGKDISTKQFAGKEVSMNGLFFFLSPQEGDVFEENTKDNKLYSEFLKIAGVPLSKVEVDGVMRYYLPEVHPEAFLGKPMFAYIGKSKPFLGKQGDMITLMQVQFARSLSGGEPIKISQGLRLPI